MLPPSSFAGVPEDAAGHAPQVPRQRGLRAPLGGVRGGLRRLDAGVSVLPGGAGGRLGLALAPAHPPVCGP
jgi:hypothetical protein